jgi:hypothetical protein
VNNLVVLTSEMAGDSSMCKMMMSFLQKYRRLVNSHLLFIAVEIAGTSGLVMGFFLMIFALMFAGCLRHFSILL